MPVLAILLPDFALVAVLTGLRFLENDNAVVHFAFAITSGALAGCMWSNIRIFLMERSDEPKLRTLIIGAGGAAVFGVLYLVFGSWLLDVHEIFLIRRNKGLGPPVSDMALTMIYIGMIGAAVSLLVDHGRRN